MKHRLINLSGYLLTAALVFILGQFRACQQLQRQRNQTQAAITALGRAHTEYVDRQGRLVAQQSQIIADQKTALALGLEEVANLKKITSQVQLQTATTVRNQRVGYRQPVEVKTEIRYIPGPGPASRGKSRREPVGFRRYAFASEGMPDTAVFARLPLRFDTTTPYYSLAGRATRTGLLLDSLQFINRPVLTLGYEKKPLWQFWRPAKPVAVYWDENPYARVQKFNPYTVTGKKPVYQQNGFWFTLGVGVTLVGQGLLNK